MFMRARDLAFVLAVLATGCGGNGTFGDPGAARDIAGGDIGVPADGVPVDGPGVARQPI